MNNNEKTIEELTFRRIKNLGPDTPSADFTQKVMQSIMAEKRPVYSPARIKYLWLTTMILVVFIICWYLVTKFHWSGYLDRFWIAVFDFLQSIVNVFLSISDQFKSVDMQPMVLISFVAMFSLLIIEEFIRRTKRAA